MLLNMKDSDARKNIIEHVKNNILVKASAGSGKTTILVEKIVSLVEQGRPINQIVGVTFTKKAANEFYERLYRLLATRSRDDFKLEDTPHTSLGMPEHKERDKNALNNIDSCFLGTIDAFIQRIIKEHPLEVGVASSTTIIDDNELQQILFKTQSYFEASLNPKIAEARNHFNEFSSKKNFIPIITSLLSYSDYSFIPENRDFESIKEDLIIEARRVQQGLIKLRQYLNELKIQKKISGKSEQSWRNFDNQIEYISKLNIDDASLAYRTFDKKKFENLDFIVNEEAPIFELSRYLKVSKTFSSYSIKLKAREELEYVSSITYPLLVMEEVIKQLQEEGKITFNRALRLTVEMLRKDDGKVINVLSKLQNKYKYYLLDECQDTDSLQYELFLRLTAKENKKNYLEIKTKEDCSLFIVGDQKQSIYHFKGADVSTYMKIHDLFMKYQQEGDNYEVIKLDNNYRSDGKLTKYFNNVFSEIMSDQDYSLIPDKKFDEKDHKGVYLYQTDNPNNSSDIVSLIRNIKGSGLYSYRDFMVITKGKDRIKEIAKSFLDNDIPFFSEGNISYDSDLIKTVLSLFKYAINPSEYNKYELLVSPLFNADITRPIVDEPHLINENLLPKQTEIPSEYLSRLIKETIDEQIFSLEGLDTLIGLLFYLKAGEYEGSIDSLYDATMVINDLTNENERERFALLMSNVDAVHIANVHKVKGLQNKVVIIAYAGPSTRPPERYCDVDNKIVKIFKITPNGDGGFNSASIVNPYLLDTDPDLEKEKAYKKSEDKRLLYVAATRAEDILLIPDTERGFWSDLITNQNLRYFSPFPNGNKNDEVKRNESYFDPSFDKEKLIKESSKDTYKIHTGSKTYFKVAKDEEAVDDYYTVFSVSNMEDYGTFDSKLFGTIVHKLMEIIVKRRIKVSKETVKNIIDEYLAKDYTEILSRVYDKIYSGGYPQESCPFSDIYQVIHDNECYAEVPFSYKKGNDIYYGIIDLLIINDDKVIIIDYKTDTLDVDHSGQLNAYIDAVKHFDIAKGKSIEAYIYNIREDKALLSNKEELN